MNIPSSSTPTTATPLPSTSGGKRQSVSLLSRDSFLGRWLSGMSGGAGDATSADDDNNMTSSSSSSLSCASSKDRDVLVQRLTKELQNDKNQTFQLSADEVRLLLNLPPTGEKSGIGVVGQKLTPFETMMHINEEKSCEMRSSSFDQQPEMTAPPPPPFTIERPKSTIKAKPTTNQRRMSPVPPPVEPLQPMSNVFDAWDMNSKENLSPEEIQAVMLALMAAEGGGGDVATGNSATNAGKDGSHANFPMIPLSALKKASIHRLISDESEGTAATTDFVVTFDDIDDDVSACTNPTVELLSDDTIQNIWGRGGGDRDDQNADDDGALIIPLPPLAPTTLNEEDELRFMGSAARPNTMSSRQYTIQPFPEEEDQLDSSANKPMPLRLSCRQASVRPLKRNTLARGTSFVVSLPSIIGGGAAAATTTVSSSSATTATSSSSITTTANNDKAPTLIRRQPTSDPPSKPSSNNDKAPKLVTRQITLQRHQWNANNDDAEGRATTTAPGVSASSLSSDGGNNSRGGGGSSRRRRPTMFRMNGQNLSYYPSPLS